MINKRKNKRNIILPALILVSILLVLGAFPKPAYAAATDLTVSAGFYGGPYYKIHMFTNEEMEELATSEPIVYSGLDTGNFVRICYAWGVKMETLLDECNIDMDSVQYFHMSTLDKYGESTTTFSSDILSDRYFLPNLAREMPAWGVVSTCQDNYNIGAVKVPALLAINCTDFSREEALRVRQEGNYQEPSPSDLSGEYRYRLIFGQKLLTDSISGGYNVQTSGKYVNAIEVQLKGSPGLTVDKTLVSGEDGKVGSKYILTVDTTLPDTYSYLSKDTLDKLEQQVLDNVKVSGYDTNILSVTGLDDDSTLSGNSFQVEIVGSGYTQIQLSYSRKEYGGGTTSASVAAGMTGIANTPDDNDNGNGNNDNGNNDNNNGNGNNDNGSGSDDNGNNNQTPVSGDETDSTDSGKTIVVADNNLSHIMGGTSDTSDSPSSDTSQWVAFDPQSTVIDFSADGQSNILVATGMIAGLLLLGGLGAEILGFRRSKRIGE